MNSLPSNIGRHTLFRDNDNSHTFVFQDSFPLPAPDKIKMQVRYHGKIRASVIPEIAVDGQRVTYTYTPEMLANIPDVADHYLVLDGKSFLGGQLGVLVGYGEQDISETQVTIVDGEVTVVEVMGLALVEAQVDLATEKANEASVSAASSAEWAQAAGDFSASAGSSASAATIAKNQSVSAQNAAEAARDVAVNLTTDPMPETWAVMKTMLVQGQARDFTIQHDEFHGIDYNLIHFNGQKLFAFNVIIDESEQPIFE